MTQEEKSLLLLQDLSARSSYGVICQFIWTYSNETTPAEGVIARKDDKIRCINFHIKEIQADYYEEWVDLEHCKPYLRPMSSMTEEEKNEYLDIKKEECDGCVLTGKGDPNIEFLLVDWLYAHHFDFRGLIEKGLAISTKEFNPYKE